MARELGYSTEMQRAVRICGLLHDVDKIAVPDAILRKLLRKLGRLNNDEFSNGIQCTEQAGGAAAIAF